VPKIVTLLLILTCSPLALAKTDTGALAKILYPASVEDQVFVAKFFDIVDLHKTSDPLFEGRGPSIRDFSLDKIKFAFMVNDRAEKIDLVFFNWNLSLFSGLERHQALSQLYGSSVYVLKNLDKKSLATQGKGDNQLTNFSYLHGARYMETVMKVARPEMPVPKEFLNWKPHPDYMDGSHPLRETLDTRALVLLSPRKELLFQQFEVNEATRPMFETTFIQGGGYYNVMMGMMIHEMFHVKEGDDIANRLARPRDIPENRKALVGQLKTDTYLKSLYVTYAKLVFSIGDALKSATPTAIEIESLGELKAVIAEIQTKYPNAWTFIWNYEYTEGFAEYVSAYSMIQAGITPLSQQIDLQKIDETNFVYRTGALGGLYLAHRLKTMPFDNNEDHSMSLWEIILAQGEAPLSSLDVQGIIQKYDFYPFDGDAEIAHVIDYLVSTAGEE
jgi:hypothetical protein